MCKVDVKRLAVWEDFFGLQLFFEMCAKDLQLILDKNEITMRKLFTTFILLILSATCIGQTKDWTKNEQEFYVKMKSMCEHFKGKTYDTTQRDFVFKEYVYFDNILSDTSKTRIQERIKFFDGIFYRMTLFIDSVGLENLDAMPTAYFKDNGEFFKPFDKEGELNELLPLTLSYFDKRRPNEPLGTLLFESKSHKLLSWIIIDQGGYCYFLTFNLI